MKKKTNEKRYIIDNLKNAKNGAKRMRYNGRCIIVVKM
jgi:hypothetical protein